MNRIANCSGDGPVRTLLKLEKGINGNAISATLKKLGQGGSRKLQALLLSKNSKWLRQSELKSITLDADPTVKTVCGDQQGAAKGYNPKKKGCERLPPVPGVGGRDETALPQWVRDRVRLYLQQHHRFFEGGRGQPARDRGEGVLPCRQRFLLREALRPVGKLWL